MNKHLIGYIWILIMVSKLMAQSPCKTVVFKACINDESRLHIKHGVLTWEQDPKGYAPGTHFDCSTADVTKVNGKEWKDWKTPFKLDFNTDEMEVEVKVTWTRDVSKIQQLPSKANNWETIWYFNDIPSPSTWNYSLVFTFCPANYNKPKNNPKNIAKDSIKPLPEIKKPREIEVKENILLNLRFENGKTIITKSSLKQVDSVYNLIKNKNIPIEICGYESSDINGLKLFEERCGTVANYLLSKGITQERIKYVVYTKAEKKSDPAKKIKCSLIITKS